MKELPHPGRKTEVKVTIILEHGAILGKGYAIGKGRMHRA